MGFPFSTALPIAALLLSFILPAAANTEKVIFTAPEPVNIPPEKPTLRELNLRVLNHDDNNIRTNLSRVFPTEPGNAATGVATWLLLDSLTPGQRYELRQPTAFELDVYELDTVWSTPELLQSLAAYSDSVQSTAGIEADEATTMNLAEQKSSVLLLQVRAAADYFTDHGALMTDPPPVLGDLILDPYLYNVLPQSLIPTIGYIIVVSLVAYFGARTIASKLQSIAITTESTTKKES
ncbi:hypothetical protein BGZ63DRAFT_443097 [Mariannaea sp. PMI_226]|nr:hypothetical protein BGZ63DRAFT_443097 [Mariannaea sp. PMI_226]